MWVLFAKDWDSNTLEDKVVLDEISGFVFFDFGRDFVCMPGTMCGVIL